MEDNEREEGMSVGVMQRYIDQAMREGKTYEQALARLAWIPGLHPADMEWDEGGNPMGKHLGK